MKFNRGDFIIRKCEFDTGQFDDGGIWQVQEYGSFGYVGVSPVPKKRRESWKWFNPKGYRLATPDEVLALLNEV